ncbi:MAG: hypothetical protein K8I29_04140 [Alphaproteobacteria bacterium]|uniref:Uncharacterized protein n=1 Tax=Candidatus Nitrobium versatile TaxID=2884831 RepID=A0A953JA84_9BACT|nr:hypothetical protein [Candidatus Nitrobium versatile]
MRKAHGIGQVDLHFTEDMKVIRAAIQGKIVPFRSSKPGARNRKVRVYLLEPPDTPVAVFDAVPYDVYYSEWANRGRRKHAGAAPGHICIAAFTGKRFLGIEWVDTPALMRLAILLAPYFIVHPSDPGTHISAASGTC